MQGHAILRVGEVFCGKPPRNRVMFHPFKNKSRCKGRRVALHHLKVEATDALYLPERKRMFRVGIFDIEIIGAHVLV